MTFILHHDTVEHILNAHASGNKPNEIHAQLVKKGHSRLPLYAVKDCLLQNGRAINDDDAKNNTPGPSNHVELLMVKPWDAEADKYAFDAYLLGKSVHQTWMQLRGKGYSVTEAEVVASLDARGIQGFGITA